MPSNNQDFGSKGSSDEDPLVACFPKVFFPGAFLSFCRQSRLKELQNLEDLAESGTQRKWQIRAILADELQLSTNLQRMFDKDGVRMVSLPCNPMKIWMKDGENTWMIFYELVANDYGNLYAANLTISARYPTVAMLTAWYPINALLDRLVAKYCVPIYLARIELLSPIDGLPLPFQMLVPSLTPVAMGKIVELFHVSIFAPYDAIFREALNSSSPFYRLLCAFRIHEGIDLLRREIQQKAREKEVKTKLPSDPKINHDLLTLCGVSLEGSKKIKNVRDLFKHFSDLRHSIAHFKLDRNGRDSQVYLAEGQELARYAIVASILLNYAHENLQSLSAFHGEYIADYQNLTLPANVVASDYPVTIIDEPDH